MPEPSADPADPVAPPPKSGLRRALPLAVVLIGAALGWWWLGDRLNFETLRENREALLAWRESAWWQAAAAYVLAYVAVVAFSLPGALAMTLTGGFVFGLVPGALLTVSGATLGAIAIFLAAKTSLGDRLAARLEGRGGFMARLQKGMRENEVSVLLLMRLVPAMPFFLANLAPAFLGVRLWTYAWTTFFGIMPGTVVYTWVGAGLGEVFEQGGRPDLSIIFDPMILGPLLGLCALAALPMVVRRVRGTTSPVAGEGAE